VSLIGTPLIIGFIVLVQWPKLSDSSYHEKLWKIRDQVMDDVLAGDLSWSPGARNLISHLESLARHSQEVNLLKALLAVRMDVIGSRDVDRFDDIMLGDATPVADRNKLLAYLSEAQRATLRQSAVGGIDGLIGASIIVGRILTSRFRSIVRAGSRPTTGTVRRVYVGTATPVAQAEMLQLVRQDEAYLRTSA
jgi:hypothetical protein